MTPITVKDIMAHQIVSVHPETPVREAYALIVRHGFDGVPVVDREGHLMGILTEYDLITKSSLMHLPTLQKVLGELKVFDKNSGLQHNIAQLEHLTVKEVMNSDPLTLPDDASLEDVISAFRDHHRVNPIPVIDKNNIVVGVVSRYDVLHTLYP